MAFPHTVYLSEEQTIATADSQMLPLGTRGVTVDGRVFRYAHNAATALATHNLVITAAEGPASTTTYQVMNSTYNAGTTMVSLFLSTVALPVLATDYFKDGWLVCFSTDSAFTQSCPIDSHPALASATAAAGTACLHNEIYLKAPGLKKNVDTDTSLWKLINNPYNHVIVSTTANGPGHPLGITPCTVATSYYFWLQTWGPTLARVGEANRAIIDTLAQGTPVAWSTAVAGSIGGLVSCSASGYIPDDTDCGFSRYIGQIGTLINAAPASTFFCMIDLRLAP